MSKDRVWDSSPQSSILSCFSKVGTFVMIPCQYLLGWFVSILCLHCYMNATLKTYLKLVMIAAMFYFFTLQMCVSY